MNLDVLALTGDDAVVNEVVHQHTSEFAARGFEFREVTLEGSQELGRFPIFHFLNQQTGMRIDISFIDIIHNIRRSSIDRCRKITHKCCYKTSHQQTQ